MNVVPVAFESDNLIVDVADNVTTAATFIVSLTADSLSYALADANFVEPFAICKSTYPLLVDVRFT